MGELKYKTYSDKVPTGLIPVLFCAADEDFNHYFETLSDSILAHNNNIALFYFDDYENIDEDDILSMSLVIAPITRSFLNPDCVQRLTVFETAIDNNIPILPLQGEPGIDLLFNQTVDNLHILTCGNAALDSMDYAYAISREIRDILMVTEDLELIRSAFKAYIFLSYRKSDADYLKKVMATLSDIDYLRDVAFWYDGYLVPGENFNNVINDNLLKSQLMALIVTPSITEGDNYVKTVEYPTALSQGIPVLPILAQPVDQESFVRDYSAVSSLLVENTSDSLGSAIKNYIHIDSLDNDPDHLRLIGLAYLLGIDVPKNASLAVELLEKSFQDGCNEAGSVLANIFMNGKYVECDYVYADYILAELANRMLKERQFDNRDDYLQYIALAESRVKTLTICGQYEYALETIKVIWETTEAMAVNFPASDDNHLVIKAKRRYLNALSQHPEYKEKAMELLEEIYADYSAYTEAYGYHPDFSIVSLYSLLVEVADSNPFSHFMDLALNLIEGFDMERKEDQDLYIFWLKDYVEFQIEYLNTILYHPEFYSDSADEFIISQEFFAYISDIEDFISTFTKLGRDFDSYNFNVTLYHTLGLLYIKYNHKQEAERYLTSAYEICDSCLPDIEFSIKSIDILLLLISLYDDTQDDLKFYYYTELENIVFDLYQATGLDKYREICVNCRQFIDAYKKKNNT